MSYTYAAFSPLAGGMNIGVERILKKSPEYIASFPGFWKNDSLYVNWLKQNNREAPYHMVSDTDKLKHVDLVTHVCPCAALSMMNSSKNENAAGASGAQNDYMFLATEASLATVRPRVVIGENAPALYTVKGEQVANKLQALAEKYGYSFTLYKTNTVLHGVPQKRERTYYFFWDSKTAPILQWYNRPVKTFAEYLEEIPANSLYQGIPTDANFADEPFYKYFEETYGNVRKLMTSSSNTPVQYIRNNPSEIDKYLKWAKKNAGIKAIARGEHVKKKFDAGMSVWDPTVRYFFDVMNTAAGRNLFATMHPTEERTLTVREIMHMMSMPHEYTFDQFDPLKELNLMAQNVGPSVAGDMVEQAVLFMDGKLPDSGVSNMRQNNCAQRIDSTIKRASLESFI